MIPTILWHQSPRHIHLVLEVLNVINEKITIEDNIFHFNGTSSNKNYEISFELSNQVIPKETGYVVNENNIKIILSKTDETEWTQLQKDKSLFKNNIKINWDLWDEDDDDEPESNYDMARMMQQMGMGMPNFNRCSNDGCNSDEDYPIDFGCPNTDCCDEKECCSSGGCKSCGDNFEDGNLCYGCPNKDCCENECNDDDCCAKNNEDVPVEIECPDIECSN